MVTYENKRTVKSFLLGSFVGKFLNTKIICMKISDTKNAENYSAKGRTVL